MSRCNPRDISYRLDPPGRTETETMMEWDPLQPAPQGREEGETLSVQASEGREAFAHWHEERQ